MHTERSLWCVADVMVKSESEWCVTSVLTPPDGRGLMSPSVASDISDRDPGKMVARSNCKNEDICLICGDRASGYHYNALSCEGCKGESAYIGHYWSLSKEIYLCK
jgi:hypothetical protein